MKISAAVITWNDQANIDPCLESLQWVDEVVVVDVGSQDRTLEKLKSHGAKFEVFPLNDFSTHKNAVLEKATGDWVLFVEANERIPSDLAREIQKLLGRQPEPCAYTIKRETSFFEKKLNYGGTQNEFPVRLWPRGRVYFNGSGDEAVVTDLPVRSLSKKLMFYGVQNQRHYRQKIKKCMPFEVKLLRKAREEVWVRDYTLRPVWVFLSIYFGKLGFLDGWAGIQFAYLAAHYEFLKYYQFKKQVDSEILGIREDL